LTTVTDRIEGLSSSVALKAPVKAASTANVTLYGIPNASDFDGITIAADDDVLLVSQTDSTENGIYTVKTGNWQRRSDFDGSGDVVGGTHVFVTNTGASTSSYYMVDGSGSVSIGTDNITFSVASINTLGSVSSLFSGLSSEDLIKYDGSNFINTKTLAGNYTLSGNNTLSGSNTVSGGVSVSGMASIPDASELTISSGVITPTASCHYVATEGGAGSDDIDTITAGSDGDLLVLRASSDSNTVVIKHDTGNIITHTGSDISLDDNKKTALLRYSSSVSKWVVISGPVASTSGISTSVMKGRILYGLTIANSASDSLHDIDISAGASVSEDGSSVIELTSAITKQIDAAWAAGSNAGGLDTGTVAASTWYYVFIIKNTSTGIVDALFSTSKTSPTMPSGYTIKKRIGAVLTDSSADIIQFIQTGNVFRWKTAVRDVNASNPGTSGVLHTLSAPPDTIADISASVYNGTTNRFYCLVTAIAETDSVPSASIFTLQSAHSATAFYNTTYMSIVTDSNSQIRTRFSASGSLDNITIITLGWTDTGI